MAGGVGGAQTSAVGREDRERKAAALLAIIDLSNLISVPMSLNAVVRLNVPDAIYQSGLNAPLTAAEILSRLVPAPPSPALADPSNLQRILRTLASHGVFREHLGELGERRYSLTDVGMTLVAPDGGGESYAPYVLQHHQEALVRAWPLLHEAVLDPTVTPFSRANGGVPAYAYYGKDPGENVLMQRSMRGVSEPFMAVLLDHEAEHGLLFSGVRTLVDVGGSSGASLNMILRRVPTVVAGVNFDLPEVVAQAPQFPGITHVGGDMLQSIPSGDALFSKWTLTSWDDDECRLILKNCRDALPPGGKLILCEPVQPKETDDSRRVRALLQSDISIMSIYSSRAKSRTEEDYRLLGSAVGLAGFRTVPIEHPFFTVMVFQK